MKSVIIASLVLLSNHSALANCEFESRNTQSTFTVPYTQKTLVLNLVTEIQGFYNAGASCVSVESFTGSLRLNIYFPVLNGPDLGKFVRIKRDFQLPTRNQYPQ